MRLHRSAIFVAIGGGLLLQATVFPGRQEQPIRFNHNLHISEVDLDCTDCHEYVLTNRKATLPGRQICMTCHEEPLGDSAEEKKLVELLTTDQKLDWKRVYVLPKHVYFSHFRHVTLGQIACADCHGDMKALTQPPVEPTVDIIDMDYCIDCHKQRQVNNDCLMCHN